MEVKRKGYSLKIYETEMCDPRHNGDEGRIGTMVCFHRRYNLGDKHDFKEPDEFNEWYEQNKKDIVCCLPLYLLDHSGLAMSVTSFHDPWDSGQVGYIYTTKKDLERVGLDENDKDYIKGELINEVKEYDSWLRGDPPYYSYIITDENDRVVENRGFFACETLKDMLDEMSSQTDEEFGYLFKAMLKQEEACL